MKGYTGKRIGKALALGLAVGAIAAPVAQADAWYRDSSSTGAITRPDDRAGLHGPGAVVSQPVRPDDRAERSGPVTVAEPAVRPDDRVGVRGPGAAPEASPIQIVVQPTGFDWTDAGIGAGMTLGIILLAGGAMLVARRRKTGVPAF